MHGNANAQNGIIGEVEQSQGADQDHECNAEPESQDLLAGAMSICHRLECACANQGFFFFLPN
jgi:hypothetical protein